MLLLLVCEAASGVELFSSCGVIASISQPGSTRASRCWPSRRVLGDARVSNMNTSTKVIAATRRCKCFGCTPGVVGSNFRTAGLPPALREVC